MIKRIKKNYYVYIMSNHSRIIYVGYTDNLIRRVKEHKSKKKEGFTKKYNITKLVYFEKYNSPFQAENREKQLKCWHRDWKINLIESINSEWKDLFVNVLTDAETSSALIFKTYDPPKDKYR
jgi:putative endonuclease